MSKYLRARGKPQIESVLTPSLSIIYPPYLETSRKKVFSILFPFPLLEEIKVGGDSCLPQHLQTKNANQYNIRFCHRITELATLLGTKIKWGLPLDLGHF